jgi:hypothetical protein
MGSVSLSNDAEGRFGGSSRQTVSGLPSKNQECGNIIQTSRANGQRLAAQALIAR